MMTPDQQNKVIQYIIVRNDMDSMTPGRCAAQAAHAANQCVNVLKATGHNVLCEEWEKQTPFGFGTTIVLQANMSMINLIEDALYSKNVLPFGVMEDPEYHIADGSVVHLLPVSTVLWILGRKSEVEPYVSHLELL